jgi:hypothetical protein
VSRTFHLIFPDIDADENTIVNVRKQMLECLQQAGIEPQGTVTIDSSQFRAQAVPLRGLIPLPEVRHARPFPEHSMNDPRKKRGMGPQ